MNIFLACVVAAMYNLVIWTFKVAGLPHLRMTVFLCQTSAASISCYATMRMPSSASKPSVVSTSRWTMMQTATWMWLRQMGWVDARAQPSTMVWTILLYLISLIRPSSFWSLSVFGGFPKTWSAAILKWGIWCVYSDDCTSSIRKADKPPLVPPQSAQRCSKQAQSLIANNFIRILMTRQESEHSMKQYITQKLQKSLISSVVLFVPRTDINAK